LIDGSSQPQESQRRKDIVFGTGLEILGVVNSLVGSGVTVALSSAVLAQYCWTVLQRSRSEGRADEVERELRCLEAEVQKAHRERTLTNFENQLLRDFLAQPDCHRAINLLLRRCIPNPEYGCAAFLHLDRRGATGVHSRGMTQETAARLGIDPELRDRLLAESCVSFEGRDWRESALYRAMSVADREKASRMHVLAFVDQNELVGVILTTDLVPAGVSIEEQRHVARRIVGSLTQALRDKLRLQSQQELLRWNSELSDLRTIVDRNCEDVAALIEDYLDMLVLKLDADQGTLFLWGSESSGPLRRFGTRGNLLPDPLQSRLNHHHEGLAESGITARDVQRLDSAALIRSGIDSLVGAALTCPLFHSGSLLGGMTFIRQQGKPFEPRDERLARSAGEMLGTLIIRAATQMNVERQARVDALTGLANRRTFDEQIEAEVTAARLANAECSLLICDLDRFKSVNDTYGHQVGDAVLRAAAAALQEKCKGLRLGDRALAARYGGEEFVVLLPRIGLEGASRIAETIRAAIEDREILAGPHRLHVTTSIGVATLPAHAADAEELIAKADAALYHAKQTGRNRVGFPMQAAPRLA
jgi:diguanylate cyclase (GGDEF)-like protein